jgi:hypothetical protein
MDMADEAVLFHELFVGLRAIGRIPLRSPFHQAALDGTFGSLRPNCARNVGLVEKFFT